MKNKAEELEEFDEDLLDLRGWRPHMCQFFREAVLRVSRRELGKILDVDAATIAGWELPKGGRAPSVKNLDKLCRAFDCEPYELYSEFDPEHTEEFINDIFKTWSFVLQKAIRSENLTEQKFALHLTQLFMDYDERRRIWKANEPKSEQSAQVSEDLKTLMFNNPPEDLENEPEIEEGSEVDADDNKIFGN